MYLPVNEHVIHDSTAPSNHIYRVAQIFYLLTILYNAIKFLEACEMQSEKGN